MTKTLPTIAIIDDDTSVRESLRQLLRAADFRPLAFASAEEFLNARNGQQIDCLIVDVNLPGMNGVALVQTLAAGGSRVPAVLITARDDPATLELIRRAGGVPLLRKPFGEEDLFNSIAKAMRR